MIRMGTVWDRTAAFIGDRLAALIAIVGLLIFVPGVVQRVLQAMVVETGPVGGVGYSLAVLVMVILMFWGQLGIVALALDPGLSATGALRIAGRRLPPALGIWVLLGLVVLVLLAPIGVAAIASGIKFVSTGPGQWAPTELPSAGLSLFVGLYMLAFFIALIWFGARLLPLGGVIVGERRGLGAVARAFGLTRGLALRIVGVLILFGIVWAVSSMAATAVLGSIFKIVFGGDGAITLASVLTAAVTALVAAGYATVSSAFGAQLYLAACAARDVPAEAE